MSKTNNADCSTPMQASKLRRGSHVVVDGHPCKVQSISISKTGKHGHAKVHAVSVGIFDGKKRELMEPSTHDVQVPVIETEEYEVWYVSAGNIVVMLDKEGVTRSDLGLHHLPEEHASVITDLPLREGDVSGDEEAPQVLLTFTRSMGREECTGMKVVEV
eukprot:m.10818 g.10818  ORF g.10818 m.10818 type:complete len:160 (-) comp5621_c0_seq2:113-592(-)